MRKTNLLFALCTLAALSMVIADLAWSKPSGRGGGGGRASRAPSHNSSMGSIRNTPSGRSSYGNRGARSRPVTTQPVRSPGASRPGSPGAGRPGTPGPGGADRQDRRRDNAGDRREFREDRFDDRREHWERHHNRHEWYEYRRFRWRVHTAAMITAAAFNTWPCYSRAYYWGGARYYYCGSYWYQPTVYQTSVHYVIVSPPAGVTITKVEVQNVTPVVVNGETYYYADASFYRVITKDGSESYVAVDAPIGAQVVAIPDTAVILTADGANYFAFDKTYFRPVEIDGKTLYEVVPAPS